MKMIKQILTGLAVLVLAIAIVDCNANLQQVLEQPAANSTAATKDIPKTECTDEASSKVAAASQESVPKDNEPAGKDRTELKVGTQVDEKKELVGQEPKESTRQQPQSSKTSKTNKYKVITISIPEDSSAEVLVVDSTRDEKQDDQSPSVKDDKPVDSKANSTSEDTSKLPAEGSKPEEQQQPAKDEKPTKKQDVKSKSDKKVKSKSMKRDKRETKRSGSSKNSKTKRSAEKSKKYESKKKSKK